MGNFIDLPFALQMLEYRDRSEECLHVLEKYAKNNQDNPNGLKFIYEYHKKIESELEVQIKALEVWLVETV